MRINTNVTIKSFLGLQKPNEEISDDENYWILIGEKGKVIEENNKNFSGKVLVLFDKNLDKFNLQNHNPTKNSLWILESDLEFE